VFPARYEHHLHTKSEAIPVTGSEQWRPVFPVRHGHHLHTKCEAIPLTGSEQWRPVFPVRYEHHVHTKSEAFIDSFPKSILRIARLLAL
jgi:hypothetical protein